MDIFDKLFKKTKPANEEKTLQQEMPDDTSLQWTRDANALELGFWLGTLQVAVETGNVHKMSNDSLKDIMANVDGMMKALGLTSAIDTKTGLTPIKEEVKRSCSPSCQLLFLAGLLFGDLGHPDRPLRNPEEIERLKMILKPMGIPGNVLGPLSNALTNYPPPSERFNAALVQVKSDLIKMLNK